MCYAFSKTTKRCIRYTEHAVSHNNDICKNLWDLTNYEIYFNPRSPFFKDDVYKCLKIVKIWPKQVAYITEIQ
jgi:hypothetical protein